VTTAETRLAIVRLMWFGSKALEAKWAGDAVRYADLRTSTDDCRIAIRATTGQQ
jgi:hypothetical protein